MAEGKAGQVGSVISMLRRLHGYPWLPCPICKSEGFQNAVGSCDHTALERARAFGLNAHASHDEEQ